MGFERVKNAVLSKTIWGILITVIPPIAIFFDVAITAGDVTAVEAALAGMFSSIGAILGIYGRVKADSRVEILPS